MINKCKIIADTTFWRLFSVLHQIEINCSKSENKNYQNMSIFLGRNVIKACSITGRRAFHPSPKINASAPVINAVKKGRFSPIVRRTALVTLTGTLIYDGVNDFEMCGSFGRFMRSLKIAVVISTDYLYSLYGLDENTKEYREALQNVNQRSAERLLNGALANGGLYIKIGQGVAAINHILPKEYTSTLKKLENECLPRKANEVKQMFVEEFGQTPEELFTEFDYDPIAAASLAQVFKATTKEGRQVAVKVQYIDLAKRFSGDFSTILILQNLVKFVHKNYNFSWILNDLRGTLEQELDFIHEAHNAERCAKDLKKFDYVHIPTIDWKLTTKRILTAEWIDGYKISDIERIKRDKFSLREIDQKLFNVFAEQIFNTGFVHADPHSGNVFLRKRSDGSPELVLLDHGLYEILPHSVRRSLCQFWEAIVLKDRSKMDRFAKELNVDDSEKLAEILLQRPIDLRGPQLGTSRLTDDDIAYFQQEAKKHFDVVLDTLKKMPRNMLLVVRNLNTIRSIARLHGDPIDRPTHMAKFAQRCLYSTGGINFFNHFKWLVRRIRFDYHLFKMRMHFWLIRTYLSALILIGQPYDELKLMLENPKYD